MSTHSLIFLLLLPTAVQAAGPGLGQPVGAEEIKAWDITVLPDGAGLPPGSGTAKQGAAIYAQKCMHCHGEGAKGGVNAALVGAPPIKSIEATKTIANFWPYATTVFDYIRRAMPWQSPRTLTDDEAYALTAFILAQNQLIPENEVVNAQSLPKVPHAEPGWLHPTLSRYGPPPIAQRHVMARRWFLLACLWAG